VQETDTNSANKYQKFKEKFSAYITHEEVLKAETCFHIKPEKIKEVVSFLKTDFDYSFSMMLDLFGVDYLKYVNEQPDRFCVVYVLYSFDLNDRVILKCYLPEKNPQIDSIHEIYKAANWFEREAWDLYGIEFKGHPNLIRILTHVEFVGHPLRKDYPAERYQQLKNVAPASGI
jgi:NADH/F420H2 dehydrogenase subunit C